MHLPRLYPPANGYTEKIAIVSIVFVTGIVTVWGIFRNIKEFFIPHPFSRNIFLNHPEHILDLSPYVSNDDFEE
jgi:hypothetical protein